MQVSVVPGRALQERLDADFYAPEYLLGENQLQSCGIGLSTIGTESEKCNCGATPKRVVYSDRGTGLIRGAEIRPCTLRTELVALVENLRVSASSNVAALPGDLVYTMSGASLGDAAVVPDGAGVLCFTNTVVRARFKPSMDARFVAAFLSTTLGRQISARYSSGGDRGHVMPNVFRRLPIPMPDETAQRYIGAKLRLAERLRREALARSAAMAENFRSVHQYSAERRLGSWRQRARTVNEERLDATYYAPPAVQLVDALRSEGSPEVAHLSVLVKDGGFDPAKPISYFEIGGLDISTGCAWPTVVPPGEAPSRAQRVVRHWDILVGTVRPERKNVGIVPPSATGQLVATSGVAVLRVGSAERAAYLWGFLRSDAATEQLMRWNTGAAYPAIDDDVPPRVLMPAVSDDEMTRLGARWMRIPMLHAAANALVAAVRLLVEALIERKVSEAELMTASKDPHADRALLSRLHDDGLDGTGEPLFQDLDALAELLAEAASTR